MPATPLTDRIVFSTRCFTSADLTEPTIVTLPFSTSVLTSSFERFESALAADSNLSKLDVSTLVENGKVTIVGSVRSAEVKQRVEKTIRSVKGVAGIDDQLVITATTPSV